MTNCTAWELRALRSSRICGAFLHGEIAAAEEHNQVYVGADTLFGMTESEHDYLPIDQTLLDDLQGLDADWHNIDQYLEHAQQQTTISSASRQIMQQEILLRSNTFLDKETELENLVKFKFDDKKTSIQQDLHDLH